MQTTNYFESGDGIKFYYRQRLPEAPPKALIVGVHGFAEHGGRYAHIEQYLARHGYAFYIMDNRGHGYSEGRRGHIDRYDIFVDDLREFMLFLRRRMAERRVFLLGHSNGSLISLRYALRHQDELTGLVLSGAALRSAVRVPAIKLKLMPLFARLIPAKMFAAGIDPAGLSHDPVAVKQYMDDPLVFRVISAGFAYELFRAMSDTLARAAELRLPALMLHGAEDPVCDPAAARDFHEHLASADKTLRMYPGMFHEVFNEVEKEKALADVVAWLDAHL